MGNSGTAVSALTNEPYITLDPGKSASLNPIQFDDCFNTDKAFRVNQIARTAFQSTWSMIPTDAIPPPSRTGHFTVYIEEKDIAVIGYGMDTHDNLLNDIWALDFDRMRWSQVKINTSSIIPRTGATAICHGTTIFVFGGFSNNQYIADFHAISINRLQVSYPQGQYTGPPGRIGHVMSEHDGKIMIWGGYNGDWLSDLWIYEIQTGLWREVECSVKGRTATSYCNHGDYCYIFGASRVDGLLRFDWTTETMETVDACGSGPNSEVSSASLVAVDRYLLLQGGKLGTKRFGYVYGYDTVRRRWFVFHVCPDEITTTKTDGHIDDAGHFMVPRTNGASSVFRKRNRTVNLFMGAPFTEPPMVSVINVGESLGLLHLQVDMLDQLDWTKSV